jgi:hypothetical protein
MMLEDETGAAQDVERDPSRGPEPRAEKTDDDALFLTSGDLPPPLPDGRHRARRRRLGVLDAEPDPRREGKPALDMPEDGGAVLEEPHS